MGTFTRHDIIILCVSIAAMLGLSKIMGELFNRIKIPPVVGEIFAGIMLGPTLLGRISPELYTLIFPAAPSNPFLCLETFILLGVIFLLLVAGLEVDLSSVIRQGKTVMFITIVSITIPFFMGMIATLISPGTFGGNSRIIPLAIFVGISVSITALPLIARILLNMQLFHTDFGVLIMTSAVIKDLAGWFLFSILIQLVLTGSISGATVAKTVVLTLAVSILILTLLRYLINLILPRIQSGPQWQGRVITFTVVTGLLLSALSEAVGIHAIFGAFLAGIAIGDSPHLREQTRNIITQFVDNIFAPLFFVSIGLRIDIITGFNPLLPVILLLIIYSGKFSAMVLASRFLDMKLGESMAIASGMSSSGAMGIILGIFALHNGLIREDLFEAIVLSAVVTSILSGPLMKYFLKSDENINLVDLIDNKLYLADLKAMNPAEAIKKMSAHLSGRLHVPDETVAGLVIEREAIMSTGIGNNVAIPHAKIPGLRKPCVVIARAENGIDFDSIDGKPAHLIFMILTPTGSQHAQIQLLADISNIFMNRETRENAIKAKSYREFMSVIKTVQRKSRGQKK